MEAKSKRKLIWSWALYDWANSAFATTVIVGFFPLFFKQYWSGEQSAAQSTYLLGIANSASSVVLALMAPALGAIADRGAWRKRFLLVCTLLGSTGAIALGFIDAGAWLSAAIVFSIGSLGFNAAMTFYDSLLMEVADPAEFDRVSALGYSIGYLGGGVLFALNVAMYLSPATFGISDGVQAIKYSFITVGIWWIAFSMPLFFFVPERPPMEKSYWLTTVKHGFQDLFRMLRDLRGNKPLLFFLAGYLLYNDAVITVQKMAVDFGMSLGFEAADLIKALIIVQFVGFPAAIAFGFLASKFRPERCIWLCIAVYLGVLYYGVNMKNTTEFYGLAIMIGLVQGGIQALSRSYYARLVTPDESAKYFGFFNMMGRFGSMIGPYLYGLMVVMTGNPRAGLPVLTIFFIGGGFLLYLSRRSGRLHA